MLNENIKELRKNKGYSQEELAMRLNVVHHGPVIIGCVWIRVPFLKV